MSRGLTAHLEFWREVLVLEVDATAALLCNAPAHFRGVPMRSQPGMIPPSCTATTA
jgi:hypothetical protein